MQVLEDDDERALIGEPFEKAAPGREGLGSAISAELGLAGDADQGAEMRLDPGGVVGARKRSASGFGELLRDLGGRVLFEDAGLRLDDLAQRPERDTVAIGETAPLSPGDELGVGLDDPRELVDETALPDPGNADESEELCRPLVSRPTEHLAHHGELAFPADEVRSRLVCNVDPEPRMRGSSRSTRKRWPPCLSPRPPVASP